MPSREISPKPPYAANPPTSGGPGRPVGLKMILEAAGDRLNGHVLENGCGVGMYVEHLAPHCATHHRAGISISSAAVEARKNSNQIVNAAGERLPFRRTAFDLILSHEVLEHVRDDALAVRKWCVCCSPAGGSPCSSPTAATRSRPTAFTGAGSIILATFRWLIGCRRGGEIGWLLMCGFTIPKI